MIKNFDYNRITELADIMRQVSAAKKTKASLAPSKAEAAVLSEMDQAETQLYSGIKEKITERKKMFSEHSATVKEELEELTQNVHALCDICATKNHDEYFEEKIKIPNSGSITYRKETKNEVVNETELVSWLLDNGFYEYLIFDENKLEDLIQTIGIIPPGIAKITKTNVKI